MFFAKSENYSRMKKIFYLVFVVAALWFAASARAWSYLDTHALLIFREAGYNDVEFDLGNISQFLNKPNGYTAAVTNWSLAPVTGVFGTDLTGVNVALLATTVKITPSGSADPLITNQIAWVSGDPSVTKVSDFRNSAWGGLWSSINSLGTKPSVYLSATSNNWYSIDPSSPAAYDIIAPPAQLGGKLPFSVEQTIPATLNLWAIQAQPSSVPNPLPSAAQVGSFSITAPGVLTFTANNGLAIAPPAISGVSRTNGVSYVTFSTVNGGTYQLLYSSALTSPVTNWPTVGSTVAGDGASHTLAHTNATASGFYQVVRSP